jgi:hypothetical protein
MNHPNSKASVLTPLLSLAVLTTCTLFLSQGAYSSDTDAFDTVAYCKKISQIAGGSYQIEAACRAQEKEAQASLSARRIPAQIESYCRKIGEIAGGSYHLMNACVDQEIAAKSKL